MRSIAMILGAAAIGVAASSAGALADEGGTVIRDRAAPAQELVSVPLPPQRTVHAARITREPYPVVAISDVGRMRPVSLWLSMGTGF